MNSAFQFSHPEVKGLISVCVVTRNARESLQNYLSSVEKSMGGEEGWEVIVVDNESTDGTKEMLKENFPQAIYIYCQPGMGFTKGINYAIAESSGEFILIATPSTEIKDDAVLILRSYLNHFPEVGVVGPKIINQDGTTQHSSKKMPTPKVAMLHTLYLFGLIKTNNLLNKYFLYNYTSEEAIEVESLTMSLMLARREVFENVGLLDENLFVWASDVDWCYNVEQTKWKQFFVPKAVAIHRRNSVSKKQPYKNLLYYHQDLKLFYKKHFSTQNGLIINTLWFIMLQIRFVLQTIRYIIKGGKDYSFY